MPSIIMPSTTYEVGHHDMALLTQTEQVQLGHSDTQFTYIFENLFHPFVAELIAKMNRESLPGMLDAKWQESLKTPDPKTHPDQDFFNILYHPTDSSLVKVEHFPKEIDVSEHGPYSIYNWELLFHVPLIIGVHLSKTQRFAEAQRWFHYVFDPTCSDTSIPRRQRFWNFLAFRNPENTKTIDEILRILSIPRTSLSVTDQLEQDAIMDGYTAILNKPFQPHAVAQTRHLAYKYCVVMKY